jgi:hypothetical protein
MKIYSLWYKHPHLGEWIPSIARPCSFESLDDAHVAVAIRTFKYGFQYKIVESEEQQS